MRDSVKLTGVSRGLMAGLRRGVAAFAVAALLLPGVAAATPDGPGSDDPTATVGDAATDPVEDTATDPVEDAVVEPAVVAALADDDAPVRVLVTLRSDQDPDPVADARHGAEPTSHPGPGHRFAAPGPPPLSRAAADRVHADVLDRLDGRVRNLAAIPGRPLLTATVDGDGLQALLADPDVVSVASDVELTTMLDRSVPLVGAAPRPGTDDIGPSVLAGEVLTGTGSTIAVIDTGVAVGHETFTGADILEACFARTSSGTGACPDGSSSQVGPGAAEPITDHGTHVASIALGRAGAAADAVAPGVAPDADLIAIQTFREVTGGVTASVADVTTALAWLVDGLDGSLGDATLHDAIAPLRAVNLSLGAFAETCPNTTVWQALQDEVEQLDARGVMTIAAAGNNGSRTQMSAPACLDGVVSVTATWVSNPGRIAEFANVSTDTDLAAPGNGIVAAVGDGTAVATKAGTSMAAPHVAGAVALLGEAAPDADVSALLGALTTTDEAEVITDTRTHGTVTGLPRLQLASSIPALPAATDAPTPRAGVTIAPSEDTDGAVRVSWEPGADTQDVTVHAVVRPGGRGCQAPAATGSCEVARLPVGQTVKASVVAVRDGRISGAVQPGAGAAPLAVPGPVRNLIASPVEGQPDARLVTWDEPAVTGGLPIIEYRTTLVGNGTLDSCDANARSCSVSNLDTDGADVTVEAGNDRGYGEARTVRAAASAPPGAPTGLSAVDTGVGGTIEVRWDAPSDGDPATSYRVEVTPNDPDAGAVEFGCTTDATTRDCTIDRLEDGRSHDVRVTASNDAGTGVAATTLVRPTGLPGAPEDVEVDGATDGVTVSWTAPTRDGGKPITTYTATASDGVANVGHCTVEAAATGCTITIAGETAVTVTVVATNDNGDGPASAPSAQAIPLVEQAEEDSSGSGDSGSGDGGSGSGDSGSGDGGTGGGDTGGGAIPPEDDADTGDALAPPTGNPPPHGEGRLIVDGSTTTLTTQRSVTSVIVSGGGVAASLSGSSASNVPAIVRDSGLVIPAGGTITLQVTGLPPGADAVAWLTSEPVRLVTARVRADGGLDASFTVPAAVADGDHTLHLVVAGSGTSTSGGGPTTLSIGLRIGAIGSAFTDVGVGTTHWLTIERLAARNIAQGTGGGRFGPGDPVQRGQMASFLIRLLDQEDPDGQRSDAVVALSDITGTTHEAAIVELVQRAIAGGFPDGTYRPGDAVTRGQMATFIAAAAGLPTDGLGPSGFSDVDGGTHAGAITAVTDAGIARGFDDGTYRPGVPVTRAQMASLLSGLLDHLEQAG